MCGVRDVALAQVWGATTVGVEGQIVVVEVDVTAGLPGIGVVGLPDASVQEARWRTRSALTNSGFDWPGQRITVSLAPAETRKHGSGLDLPIAAGILCASGQLSQESVVGLALCAELGLDGSLRPVRGVVPAAIAAARAGATAIAVAPENAREASLVPGLMVLSGVNLASIIRQLRMPREERCSAEIVGQSVLPLENPRDLADVHGHVMARQGLELAAAGGHHVLMVGPPGIGKSMLSERLVDLLPDLDPQEQLAVTAIASVAGALDAAGGVITRPPFQAPHHAASAASLLGRVSGQRVLPGSVTLAHLGVLFLDEAPEFSRPALEGLRQPLESGTVRMDRADWAGRLPAQFQLVIAANPCPCGWLGTGKCTCNSLARRTYGAKISGPVRDRMDVRIRLAPLLGNDAAGETTAAVRARVEAARNRAGFRWRECSWKVNARVPSGTLRRDWPPDDDGLRLIHNLENRTGSMRGADRVIRMAWTLADLAGHVRPNREDVAAALCFRDDAQDLAS